MSSSLFDITDPKDLPRTFRATLKPPTNIAENIVALLKLDPTASYTNDEIRTAYYRTHKIDISRSAMANHLSRLTKANNIARTNFGKYSSLDAPAHAQKTGC
jgi:hypothetical protein